MKNDGCNRGTIHFVQTFSQHIDLVVAVPTQDMSSDNSVEVTESEGDGEVKEVTPRSLGIKN